MKPSCPLLSVLWLLSCCSAFAGPLVPAPGQPAGSLSGRVVFTSGGHGWTWSGSSWVLQRPVLLEMCEDFGNVDQMNLFALYCFNAGATVVPMRPVGQQTNEVVLDNDDAGVAFSGAWSDSTFTNFYGSAGDVPYRFATLAATETATAAYTPTLPREGFYPVYTWVAHGTNRTSQLYRIRHTGGEATVRVPHHLVGNGWVFLGLYHFNAGSNFQSGAVVISNLQPTPPTGSVVIADAIRFGNGMGTIDRGGGVSGYPREEECSRYWIQNSLGQGQPTTIYDDPTLSDQNDNVGSPPRMAREMNREDVGSMFQRIMVTFHSNATTGNTNTATARGVVALYNSTVGDRTPNQLRLAQIAGQEVNNDLTNLNSLLEVPWSDRSPNITFSGSYGEIRNSAISNEFDATLIEVAFHDNTNDVKLLRAPTARTWVARAAYHAVVKYMNEFDGLPLNFLPEPPFNARARATNDGITISWSAPLVQAGSGVPTNYLVYLSTNGHGFGNPVTAGTATTLTLTNLAADRDYYFRVAAANAGGESFPSEVAGCRRSSNPAQSRVLFVNAFDRFDRSTNLRQTPAAQSYQPPGPTGTIERVLPRANNSFDYVVPHGQAISAFGFPFDSCSRLAVTNGTVALTNYQIVIWSVGQSLTNTFRAAERNVVTNFLNDGGHLFVSGADIAWDLDRASGPAAADRAFLNGALHADLGADANNNSASYTVSAPGGSIFSGSGNATFDNGSGGVYWVQNPDALTPTGVGTVAVLSYVGGNGGTAGIQYDGSAGGGRVVYLGFPFETITNAATRVAYMADVLRFFSRRPWIASIAWQPEQRPKLTVAGEPGLTYGLWASSDLANWALLGNVLTTNGMAEFTDTSAPGASHRFYRLELVP